MPYKDAEQRRKYAREWVAKRRAEWFASQRCARCGSRENLQLDHIDPTQKVNHRLWSWSAARREAELAKCQVLCHPCHVAKTGEDNGHYQHGTISMYNKHGCRCDLCRAEKKVWNARRYNRQNK